MPQVIDSGPGFGGQFGAALGGGFSTGLQALAQHKFDQLKERHHNKQRVDILKGNNIPEPIANLIATYPENQQLQALATFGELGLLNPQTQQQHTQQLQKQAITPQEQQSVALRDVLASLNPRSQANPAQRQLQQLSGANGGSFLDNLMKAQGMTQQMGQGLPEQQAAQQLQQQPQASQVAPQATAKAPTLAEAFANKPNPKEQAAQLKERAADMKISRKTAEDVNKAYRGAQESETRLRRMEKLIDTGKLNGPLFAKLVEGIQIPFTNSKVGLPQGWLTPESQEFDKLSTEYIKGAKDIFGSQMSLGEVQLLLKTIPGLTNSDEGKKALIRNLRTMNEGAKVKKEAADQIRKANGGVYPPNLEELIQEVAGPKLEELKDRFINAEVAGAEASQKQQYQDLPSPETVEGKKFRDKKTGEVVQSVDGKWVKVS